MKFRIGDQSIYACARVASPAKIAPRSMRRAVLVIALRMLFACLDIKAWSTAMDTHIASVLLGTSESVVNFRSTNARTIRAETVDDVFKSRNRMNLIANAPRHIRVKDVN